MVLVPPLWTTWQENSFSILQDGSLFLTRRLSTDFHYGRASFYSLFPTVAFTRVFCCDSLVRCQCKCSYQTIRHFISLHLCCLDKCWRWKAGSLEYVLVFRVYVLWFRDSWSYCRSIDDAWLVIGVLLGGLHATAWCYRLITILRLPRVLCSYQFVDTLGI